MSIIDVGQEANSVDFFLLYSPGQMHTVYKLQITTKHNDTLPWIDTTKRVSIYSIAW